MSTADILYEIGVEELPASFVDAALAALPELAHKQLTELRLAHGAIRALGTPRRLALLVEGVAEMQPDLEEAVTGPPLGAAFKDGQPTRAATAFAEKLGTTVDALSRIETPKGQYLSGVKREKGRPARDLLPDALMALTSAIPFRKSMRWGSGTFAFGRPIRWLVALLGGETVPLRIEGIGSGRTSYGHRFLHPGAVEITAPGAYVAALRKARVVVEPAERRALMVERLHAAAKGAGGTLIEDEFLVGENLSLVEEPQVVVGGFEEAFLELPDEVILEVARGHQRYFGVRRADGALLPAYLAVVNTAERPDKIRAGNDRVMRARLADARFFYTEDLKRPLAERGKELAGIVFQNRLGSVLDKVRRMERVVQDLSQRLRPGESATAISAVRVCKCDLVTWMVREFPELQGEIGRAYALREGQPQAVADVIRDHYRPKGAKDDTAPTDAAAIVALADRLDTLVGCFGIGMSPSGAADPFGLRRACIGTLRTLLDRGFDLTLSDGFAAAHDAYTAEKVAIDLDRTKLEETLGPFFRDRLRGLLLEHHAADVVDAALGVAAARPLDARARARALSTLDPEVRTKLGEVFKRATNIAKEAPAGEPTRGTETAELALHDAFFAMQRDLTDLTARADYTGAFAKLASLAPPLAAYFDGVLVMADDPAVRDNRLRLMRVISETCTSLARVELLGAS